MIRHVGAPATLLSEEQLAEMQRLVASEQAMARMLNRSAAEVTRLRQGIWDACTIMGMDTDGDTTPDALVSDIVVLLIDQATELRRGYDDALDELERASS